MLVWVLDDTPVMHSNVPTNSVLSKRKMILMNHLRTTKTAIELLKLDSVQSRVQSALESITPHHRYDQTPLRTKTIPGAAHKRLLVISNEGKALWATNDFELAHAHLANYTSHRVIDMRNVQSRAKVASALATDIHNSTRAISPDPPPPKAPRKATKPYDQNALDVELAAEVRREVFALELPEDQQQTLLAIAVDIARKAGREPAMELIFEVGLLQYTAVFDNLDGQIIAWLDSPSDATELCKSLNDSPDGMILDHLGKPSGRMRFKTVKPTFSTKERQSTHD